ncbi:TetR/AcrR family transcriptional regulator [Rhizobium sp. NFR03]|uniref:TetR/AcrR family transcriptional regulator n=1 Tax=Rhizobium sp. NFR03 TaxID=1566263 RepID=UPI0008D783C1|nr:TetR/AcrR family transcriptional regulator [Rhizobium sp. NFR03]SES46750.1 transcriptional regulator, TetR family [Rhizobium sp. NFR03]
MAQDTKQRMIEAAALSLRMRGLAATSFTDILAASGAARGAIYHHFPGGKDDLVEQAVYWSAREVRDAIENIEATNPSAVVDEFMRLIRPVVLQASEGLGCAAAVVTAEASSPQSPLAAAARAAFASWIDALEVRLRKAGVTSGAERSTAQLLITFLEGSLVLARANTSVDAFDAVAPILRRAFD